MCAMHQHRIYGVALKTTTNGRLLWGIEFASRDMKSGGVVPGPNDKPFLLYTAWDKLRDPMYDGEPTRCLLFTTRRQARNWCRSKLKYWCKVGITKWTLNPVQVMECVTPTKRSTMHD
jgi:hypothetical protein